MRKSVLYCGKNQMMSFREFDRAVKCAKDKWQNEVMVIIFENYTTLIHKGVIIAATGSGKTHLQAKMINLISEILGGFCIILVKSPRIQLNQQLTKEIQKIVGDKIKSIMFHSGKGVDLVEEVDQENEDEIRRAQSQAKKIGATTNVRDIEDEIKKCKAANKPLVIQSTYHSFNKLCSLFIEEGIEIEMILNDECQYVETFGHSNCIAKREYFFTATSTKGNIGGKQMFIGEGENEHINPEFGSLIYQLSPSKAIALGIITPASYINVHMEDVTELEAKELSHKTIFKGFNELKKVRKGKATNILITESGVAQIKALLKPQSELMKACNDKFHVLTIASTEGTITDNGVKILREEFSERLVKYAKDETIDLIIVHYDILSEGIDVPSMHGVLILRNVSTSKFWQILGRCLRALYGKDYGYLLIPSYSDDTSMLETYKIYLEQMFMEGYLPKDIKHPVDGGSSGEYESNEAQLSYYDVHFDILVEEEEEIQRKLKQIEEFRKEVLSYTNNFM